MQKQQFNFQQNSFKQQLPLNGLSNYNRSSSDIQRLNSPKIRLAQDLQPQQQVHNKNQIERQQQQNNSLLQQNQRVQMGMYPNSKSQIVQPQNNQIDSKQQWLQQQQQKSLSGVSTVQNSTPNKNISNKQMNQLSDNKQYDVNKLYSKQEGSLSHNTTTNNNLIQQQLLPKSSQKQGQLLPQNLQSNVNKSMTSPNKIDNIKQNQDLNLNIEEEQQQLYGNKKKSQQQNQGVILKQLLPQNSQKYLELQNNNNNQNQSQNQSFNNGLQVQQQQQQKQQNQQQLQGINLIDVRKSYGSLQPQEPNSSFYENLSQQNQKPAPELTVSRIGYQPDQHQNNKEFNNNFYDINNNQVSNDNNQKYFSDNNAQMESQDFSLQYKQQLPSYLAQQQKQKGSLSQFNNLQNYNQNQNKFSQSIQRNNDKMQGQQQNENAYSKSSLQVYQTQNQIGNQVSIPVTPGNQRKQDKNFINLQQKEFGVEDKFSKTEGHFFPKQQNQLQQQKDINLKNNNNQQMSKSYIYEIEGQLANPLNMKQKSQSQIQSQKKEFQNNYENNNEINNNYSNVINLSSYFYPGRESQAPFFIQGQNQVIEIDFGQNFKLIKKQNKQAKEDRIKEIQAQILQVDLNKKQILQQNKELCKQIEMMKVIVQQNEKFKGKKRNLNQFSQRFNQMDIKSVEETKLIKFEVEQREQLNQRKQKYLKQIHDLRHQLEQLEDLEKQVDKKIYQEKIKYENQDEQWKQLIEAQDKSKDKIQQLEEVNEFLRKKLEKKNQEINELNQQQNSNNQQQNQLKGSQKSSAEKRELEGKIYVYEQEIETWKNRYAILEKKVNGILKQKTNQSPVENKIFSLQRRLLELEEQNVRLNSIIETRKILNSQNIQQNEEIKKKQEAYNSSEQEKIEQKQQNIENSSLVTSPRNIKYESPVKKSTYIAKNSSQSNENNINNNSSSKKSDKQD